MCHRWSSTCEEQNESRFYVTSLRDTQRKCVCEILSPLSCLPPEWRMTLQWLQGSWVLFGQSEWVGPDGVVGIAPGYGLDGPGIQSQWGRDLTQPSRPALGPTQSPVQWVPVKRPGRGVDHPPASSAEVKERVELHLYSPSGSSWPVLGWSLPLPLQAEWTVIV